MYFLLDACQHPAVLRTIYFGTIIRDIVFTIIPIGIVLMTIVDFSKGLIAGKEDEQQKAVKLIPKRLMYAIIVFAIPWVVHILIKTLSDLKLNVATNYQLCIDNAVKAEGNFEYYDNLLEEEEEAERILSNIGNQSSTISGNIFEKVIADNIYQSDARWGSHTLCTNKARGNSDGDDRIIRLSGCGFCSLTMVFRTFGFDVTPDKIVDEICADHYGTYGRADPSDYIYMAKKYGLQVQYYRYGDVNPKNKFVDTFTPLLKQGQRLIVNMDGHYISVLGIKSDGTLYVGDSSRSRDYSKKGPYTLSTLYDVLVQDGGGPLLNTTAIWKE